MQLGMGTSPILMDNQCFWNMRGLNNPRKQKEVMRIFHENNVGLCGLVEIKLKNKNVGLVMQSMF